MRPDTPTGLYWSIRGHVACFEHAEQIPDGLWASERWAPLPLSSQGVHGRIYECQICSPSKTAIKRAQITHPSGVGQPQRADRLNSRHALVE